MDVLQGDAGGATWFAIGRVKMNVDAMLAKQANAVMTSLHMHRHYEEYEGLVGLHIGYL